MPAEESVDEATKSGQAQKVTQRTCPKVVFPLAYSNVANKQHEGQIRNEGRKGLAVTIHYLLSFLHGVSETNGIS